MFDNMRFTAAGKNSPLTDVVLRSLQETGELSVTGMRTPGFRALSPLMDNAQKLIDKAVLEVGLQRLSFVADLMAEGLVYNLPDPLSVTQLEWYKSNKIGAAQRTMTPSARGENKMPIVLPNRLPIYLTTDGFELDIRTLKMSQRVGTPLDTSIVKQCTRAVNEAIEDAAINGATTLDGQELVDAGYSAPGLLNAPNANTESITAADWTTSPDGAKCVADVLSMIDTLQGDKKYGPYNLYVGTVIGNAIQNDFSTLKGENTIQSRIEAIQAGGRGIRVRVTDMMPANTIVLVQMTSDVIEVVNGQSPTVIPWTSLDGFTVHNLVMAIMVPRVRSDYDGNSGICIGTP